MIAGINRVVGLNSVGLRRAKDLTDEDRRQVREAFGVLYRSDLTPSRALAEMDGRADWAKAASTFRDFLRRVLSYEGSHKRPLCPYKPRSAGPSPV